MSTNVVNGSGLLLDSSGGRVAKNSSIVELAAASTSYQVRVSQYTNNSYGTASRSAVLLGTDGNSSFPGVISATATAAYWADLAEKYESDAEYEPGTLVKFGGDKEITVADDCVNAVVSSKPGYILNAESRGVAIALCGRVPVKVVGKVKKFDPICLSNDIPGVGEVGLKGHVIARALESNDDPNVKLVLCVTQFTI